jgi:hypothetical protein
MTAWTETALRRLADRRALRAIQNPAWMKDTPEICLGLAINPEKQKSDLAYQHTKIARFHLEIGWSRSVPLRSFGRTLRGANAMSALPQKADMGGATNDVCYGPIADIRQGRTLIG